MKIAFIVESFPVLSETFITGQVVGLLERGHDVRIFAWCRTGSAIEARAPAWHGLQGRTRYLDAQFGGGRIGVRAAALARANFKAPLRAWGWLERWRQGAISTEKLNLILPFLATKFDIIHCHFGTTGHLGLFLKEAGVRAPVVTSFQGYDLSLSIASGGRDIYRDLLLKGDLVLPVSEFFRKRLIELGCEERKIVVCRHGVDLKRFAYAPRALPPGEAVRVLTVGRMVEKKGCEFLLRALAKVLFRGRDIRLSIAGDGPLKGRLEALSRELGVTERVRFLGAVDHEELPNLLRQTHIFALSSVTAANGDQEGIPVSLMEAQACGLPVLSTRHSGIPELVADGRSGFLVPERDVDALADRLDYLAGHPGEWPAIGAAGRAIVEREFDRDALIEKLIGVYRGLAGEKA